MWFYNLCYLILIVDHFNIEFEDEETFELDTVDEAMSASSKKRKLQTVLSPDIGNKKAVGFNEDIVSRVSSVKNIYPH